MCSFKKRQQPADERRTKIVNLLTKLITVDEMSVVIVDHEDEEGYRRKSDCNLSSIRTHQVFVQQRPDDVVYSQG